MPLRTIARLSEKRWRTLNRPDRMRRRQDWHCTCIQKLMAAELGIHTKAPLPAKPRPHVPGKGKADYGTAKKVCRPILTEYPQSCPTRYEPGAGAEIPVRNEPGRGLSEVRPVLVGSDLPEIHSKILSESARLRLLQFTLVDSRRDVCRPQRLLRRPRARRK